MIIALLLSGISYYFLAEGTIALEPARLFMIGLILHNKRYKTNEVIIYSLQYWSPFIMLCIPIVLYKLLYRPYGIYSGTYSCDMLFFLNWKRHRNYLAMLFGRNWSYLLRGETQYLSLWSVISGMVAFITTYCILKNKCADESDYKEIGHIFICPETRSGTTSINMIILLGLLLLVPVVMLYEYADREFNVGLLSRHGCLMQFGNAVIIGGLICVIFNKIFTISKYKKQYITISMALLLGLGTFFNNLNLDLYFAEWKQEKQFYEAFLKRFPTLPKKSDFMFDVKVGPPVKYLLVLYEFEFPINMLYAESNKPEQFRSHKVTDWYYLNTYKKIGPTKYEDLSHWGKDIYDTRELIVIRWRPGEFLVNREIVKKYPHINYKHLADKDIPIIPSVSTYPLRENMNPFLDK